MRVEILFVPDCPNRTTARDRVEAALAATGRAGEVIETEVHDLELARDRGLRGSPTILIDGHDPFGDAEPSISCRLYSTDCGIDGALSVEQLVAALS